MKPTILAILLLAPAFTFGQKFQDVSAKGAPASLSGKHDDPEMGPYAAARNISARLSLRWSQSSVQLTNTDAFFRVPPIWITPSRLAQWLFRKNASPA
jgi:hypothetical protein